jgi:hypothetical protein
MGEASRDVCADLEKLLEPIKAVEVPKFFLVSMNIEPDFFMFSGKMEACSSISQDQRSCKTAH